MEPLLCPWPHCPILLVPHAYTSPPVREGGREGGRERGEREGGREGGREGRGREGGRERGEREGGREGGGRSESTKDWGMRKMRRQRWKEEEDVDEGGEEEGK